MQGNFHWLKVQTFCYSTEDEDLIHETMTNLIGNDEFDVEVCDGEHGNHLIIMQEELKKQKEFILLFSKLPTALIETIIADIDDRVDDECTFYLRLDKQKAVQGEFTMAHHGDVISITGKVTSHPAKKEIATKNLIEFLSALKPNQSGPTNCAE
jgi:RNA-binding protein